MKLRVGACALMLVLAGCSGESPESGMAGMRGVAASKAGGSLPTSLPLARAIGASIANAPDRGALLSFPNKATPAKQEGAYTWFPTAISEAHAFKAVATGEMTVPSPDGSQVKLRYERHAEEIDGNWTWIGRVVGGDPMQEAIITFGEKAVFGSIPQADGKPALRLETRNGSLFAVQTDPSKVVSATKGHADVLIPEAATLRSSMSAAVAQSTQVSQGAVAQAAPPSASNTVDVAIGYTPQFAAANNGASGAATRLVFLVQVGNQAFANSDINGYLRIVHTLQVNYTNTNTNQTALQELTGSTGNSPVTIPAGLAPLRAARDQYGADIAMLVRSFNTPEHQGCGIAWLNGANGPSNPSQPPITAADAAWGYAVISDGYDEGSDGKEYFCAYETLVHEAAHLMGSAHDRANSRDGANLQYGAYPYSFGYMTAASAGNFYTVMAYGEVGQTAHRISSTPLKNTCGSAANLVCGVANSEDNARSLNLTIPVVATFRATVVPFGNTKDDFDGDGLSDIYWRNTSTGANVIWKSASSSPQQYVYSLQLAWTVAGLGDFDGDGKPDILWRNYSTGANAIWKNGDATSQKTISSVGTHWKVAAVGDFNGDGADDILWRNGGSNTIWRGGVASAQQAVTALDAAWTVAGVGDFNGDGVSDVLWRSTTTGANAIWRSANSASAQNVATLATYWKVAGIGDFDGDGRADILWRNGASNAIWKSGSHLTQQGVSSVPAYWVVAAVADYDGDGKDDILWRNGSVNTIWRAANASTQQAVTSQPQAWVAQVPK